MSLLDAAPSSSTLSQPIFDHLLSLYPEVLQSFYKVKIKGDDKKRREALEDDKWRYQQLPSEIKQREKDDGLTKQELERLVKWKITHQTNRPFLLPQIRKNEPKAVKRCTSDARGILLGSTSSSKPTNVSIPSRETIRKALDKVCELTGVGPATGTLILSVFCSQDVPFFEDELHAWLLPNHKVKLKYNIKEYLEMLDRFNELSSSALKPKSSGVNFAEAFEKIAFVCQHWDHVAGAEKMHQNMKKLSDNEESDADTKEGNGEAAEPCLDIQTTESRKARKAKTTGDKRQVSEDVQTSANVRRSKRKKV